MSLPEPALSNNLRIGCSFGISISSSGLRVGLDMSSLNSAATRLATVSTVGTVKPPKSIKPSSLAIALKVFKPLPSSGLGPPGSLSKVFHFSSQQPSSKESD